MSFPNATEVVVHGGQLIHIQGDSIINHYNVTVIDSEQTLDIRSLAAGPQANLLCVQSSELEQAAEPLQAITIQLLSDLCQISPGASFDSFSRELEGHLMQLSGSTIRSFALFKCGQARLEPGSEEALTLVSEISRCRTSLHAICDLLGKEHAKATRLATLPLGRRVLEILLAKIHWAFFIKNKRLQKLTLEFLSSKQKIDAIMFKAHVSVVSNCVQIPPRIIEQYVEIIDVYGRQLPLPESICLKQQVFKTVLQETYREQPGVFSIALHKFAMVQWNERRTIEGPSDMQRVLQSEPGGKFQLRMCGFSALAFAPCDASDLLVRCPECSHNHLSVPIETKWIRCFGCETRIHITVTTTNISSSGAAVVGTIGLTGLPSDDHSNIESTVPVLTCEAQTFGVIACYEAPASRRNMTGRQGPQRWELWWR